MKLFKTFSTYLLPFIFTMNLHAQILDNRNGEIFSEETFFNEEFIEKNNIKKIIGTIRTKKVNEIIKDRGNIEMYTFSMGGFQTGYLKTISIKGYKKDTSFVFYNYNNGLITMKRGNDSQGFFSYSYKRDDSGNVISEEYRREESLEANKSNYVPGKEYIIYSEKRTLESVSGTHTKLKYFNSYNKPYKETILIYDDNSYLIEENTKYLIGRNKSSINYEYNERGFLSKRIEKSYYSDGSQIKYEYTFDDHGNILSENVFRNEEHTLRKEILYTKNMLLKAVIAKDMATSDLTIIQYSYEYFKD